jgi:hypothetical protein
VKAAFAAALCNAPVFQMVNIGPAAALLYFPQKTL